MASSLALPLPGVSASPTAAAARGVRLPRFVSFAPAAHFPPSLVLSFRTMAALVLRNVLFRKIVKSATGGGGRSPKPEEEEEEEEREEEAAAEGLRLLEEDAISGEDGGREPADYDRRPHLFDESSRVFRKLKERREERHRR